MAIAYAHQTVVHAAAPGGAAGLVAYIERSTGQHPVTGEVFDFRSRGDDVTFSETLLPDDAPESLRDLPTLLYEIDRAERTIDRKTGEERWKVGAQTAWHVVLATPKELSHDETIALTRNFLRERYTAAGVAVHWVLHHDDENPHVHAVVSTRRVTPDGLGKKAPEIAPRILTARHGPTVAMDDRGDLVAAWEQTQNAFFRAHDIAVTVDPKQVVLDVHHGNSPRAGGHNRELSDEAREQAAELLQDPAELLRALGSRHSTWTLHDARRLLRRNGLEGEPLETAIAGALAHDDCLELHHEDGEAAGRWTTRAVLEQERELIERVERMAERDARAPRARPSVAYTVSPGLSAEQHAALTREAGDGIAVGRIAVIQGRAGTGKSHTLNAIRRAHELSRNRVVGLAPTNTVARSLAADGFETAMTAHLALLHLQSGREKWNRRTVVVVDEAAMLSTDVLAQLLEVAERAGARVILAGDSRQLRSIDRGGMFDEIAARTSTLELTQVRRQADTWQQQASEAFAAGDMASGYRAYDDHDRVVWHNTVDESAAALLDAWSADRGRDPDQSQFIYASTNAAVDDLNAEARRRLVDAGGLAAGQHFDTTRGERDLAPGDRIQFRGTDRKIGMYSGALGTVEAVSDKRILIRTDEGPRITIDPRLHREWDHGYAGTVYRGQGKTQTRVYALYDHAYAWSASTAYVALTRHREDLSLHVSRDLAADAGALVQQMSRREDPALSITYRTGAEIEQVKRETDEIMLQMAEERARREAEQRAREQQIALEANEIMRQIVAGRQRQIDETKRARREENDLALRLIEGLQQPALDAEAALQTALDLAIADAQQPLPHISLGRQLNLWQKVLDAAEKATAVRYSVGGTPDTRAQLAKDITEYRTTIEAASKLLSAEKKAHGQRSEYEAGRATHDDLLPAYESLAAAADKMRQRLANSHQLTRSHPQIDPLLRHLDKWVARRREEAKLQIDHIRKITAPSYSLGPSL